MIRLNPHLVVAAQEGDRNALETLVRAMQGPVYNLAVRMLGHMADAEDATQEILIKAITHLGEIREPDAAGAWAFRIACRQLVHARRRARVEAYRFTFRDFAADLEQGCEELPPDESLSPETQAMIEEVKIGCTLALLTCLSRPLRAAYILGEIFELSDREAAAALEVEPPAFRQRLRRARALITGFVEARCGIVSPTARCRCDRRIAQARRLGRIAKGRSSMPAAGPPKPSVAQVQAQVRKLERGRAATALMRSNPDFTTNVADMVIAVIGD